MKMVNYLHEMQLNNEEEMNSNINQIENCTLSTDSGVILIDNTLIDKDSITTTPANFPTKANIANQQNNLNNNKNKIISDIKIPTITDRKTRGTETIETTESDNENNETKQYSVIKIADDEKINNKNNLLKQNGINNKNQKYNVQNFINRTANFETHTDVSADKSSQNVKNNLQSQQLEQHQMPSFVVNSSDSTNSNSNTNFYANNEVNIKVPNSPTASLRSTTISIVSLDENAIDSSVVDSNSEYEPDAEGIHSNYVVKKLGQQTTLDPNSPQLQNINRGLTVVGQTITPNIGQIAENILNGELCLPAPQAVVAPGTAKVGKVTVIDSTEVSIGDQHYYDGPVTIQQFLIDSRNQNKSNKQEGHDNPTFSEHDANGSGQPNKIDPEQNTNQFNRKAIVITGTIILLTIIIGVLFVTLTPTINKIVNVDGGSDEDGSHCKIGEFCVVSREEWEAIPAKAELDKLVLPVHRVIISHTATETCDIKSVCSDRAQTIQRYHMYSRNWDDIGYNYLIGGDGRVYVGRGFNNMGAHTRGYNNDSLGISFIGTFTTTVPTEQQLSAAKQLIEQGVLQLKLAPDYKIYGARQLQGTESPGEALYKIIKSWAHWSADV